MMNKGPKTRAVAEMFTRGPLFYVFPSSLPRAYIILLVRYWQRWAAPRASECANGQLGTGCSFCENSSYRNMREETVECGTSSPSTDDK